MRRVDLLKNLIRIEILTHRALVHNACQNEMEAFSLYLIQRKQELSRLTTSQLESIYSGLERYQKVA